MGENNVLAVSNESGYGKEDILNRLDEVLNSYVLQKENKQEFSENENVEDVDNFEDDSEE